MCNEYRNYSGTRVPGLDTQGHSRVADGLDDTPGDAQSKPTKIAVNQ